MGAVFIGFGTVVNVVAVVIGSLIGLGLGDRIPARTRTTVTDVLGLFTLVVGGFAAAAMASSALATEVGPGVGTLVVLGSLLIGALVGSWLHVEDRLEALAERVRRRFAGGESSARFVDGVVTSTLVWCVGPLTILGAINDGLGRGSEQLLVKSLLDGFAAIAFASSLGVGVLFAGVPLALIQGLLTLGGFLLGDVLPLAHIDALTATGGVILLGLGLRLLELKQIAVGDLLPALLIAPLGVQLVSVFV